jgi:hypothetical protein
MWAANVGRRAARGRFEPASGTRPQASSNRNHAGVVALVAMDTVMMGLAAGVVLLMGIIGWVCLR